MTETARFRILACDGDAVAAPRLVISCANCGIEETVNDEEGGCDLGDLTAWAGAHKCRRPLSYVSVGDLLTPVDESVSVGSQRPHRRSSLRAATLPSRDRPG